MPTTGLFVSLAVVMTICGAVALFIAGSTGAMAESGIASVYAYSGSKTASGERANPGGLTAAHRTLAFGTHVRVTNRRNGRSVTVRINDRGPFVRGRVIDITPAGARALGFSGLAPVRARSKLVAAVPLLALQTSVHRSQRSLMIARCNPITIPARWVKARNCGCKIALQIRLRKSGQIYIFSWNKI